MVDCVCCVSCVERFLIWGEKRKGYVEKELNRLSKVIRKINMLYMFTLGTETNPDLCILVHQTLSYDSSLISLSSHFGELTQFECNDINTTP